MKFFSSLLLLLPITVSGFLPFKSNHNLISVNDINSLNNVCEGDICDKISFLKYHQNQVDSDYSDKINNKFAILDSFHILDKQGNGEKIVKSISSFLPHVDSIGHKVLHANNEFINSILSMDTISDDLKKDIILFSIKLAQQGDDMGSVLLQWYYDLVDKCL
jgi:acetate kinase